jgi:charged multivesicular body protein 7
MSELLTYLQNTEPQFRKYASPPFPPLLPPRTSLTYTNRARLAALYSDFRHLRTTNPDGYTANIEAWLSGLSHATKAGVMPTHDLLSFTADDELLRALETKEWGRPLTLGTIVREALARREVLPFKEFMERKESFHARSWGFKVPTVGEVLGWGLRQLGILGEGAADKFPGKVVLLENLENAAKEVERRVAEGSKGRVERIFSKSEFKDKFGDVCGKKRLSNNDLDLLLRFMGRDKEVLAFDGETVKLWAPNEKSRTAITMEDTTIASLKTLIKDLEIQTEVLTKRVDELAVTAKEAVARKNRVAALAALRSKRLAESTLTKRHATLGQLEEVFAKIEQAADQVELVRVMEASTRVLAGLNKEVGGVERVDDVVDQLREQMGQVDEVGNVIAEAGQAGTVDETEVDDELEAMEREDREKREEVERLAREEKERQEAAETKRRLDALEEVERQAKEAARKQAEEVSTEREIEESTEELKRLSLDPDPEHVTA